MTGRRIRTTAAALAEIALAGRFTPAVGMTGEFIHLMEPPEDNPIPPRKGVRPAWTPRALCGRDAIETVSAAAWWTLTPAHRCKACIRVGGARTRLEQDKGD